MKHLINKVIQSKPVTKKEAAELLGLQTYDAALPQKWLDDFVDYLIRSLKKFDVYDRVLSSFVWCYDGGSVMGYPRPLTNQAFDWLQGYDITNGTHYADPEYTVLEIKE
jgi:hypothetical protein